MQELRLVAVSEDGTYAVLVAPGQGGRFALPIDDRLRIVARGQFSRLAQYEIEVERPLRPKEIQDRIRAGETAEEIAEAAGVPIDRVRRFEGPVLAERAHWAGQAQEASIRAPGDSGPGRRLGDVVAERLSQLGADPEAAEWDSRKRSDGLWQVQLTFAADGHERVAEWQFDPRRRHVAPADDTAAGLCLPDAELPPAPRPFAAATVTPIGSRLAAAAADSVPGPRLAEPVAFAAPARAVGAAPRPTVTPGPHRPTATPSVPRPAMPSPAAARSAAPQAFPAGEPARSPTPQAPLTGAPQTGAPPAPHTGAALAPQPAMAPAHQPAAAHQQPHAEREQPAQNTPAAAPDLPAPTAGPGLQAATTQPAATLPVAGQPATAQAPQQPAADGTGPGTQPSAPAPAPAREKPARRASGRSRRSSVPSWDEIMFGTSRQSDEA